MGVLNRDEIERRLKKGGLLRNPRLSEDGRFDVEADSYDLTAGKALWKESTRKGRKGRGGPVETLSFLPGQPRDKQPTVTIQPGQMIFVITREDILMPLDLCGTVYSRNNVAMAGILALNAGHVDPGYDGPIVIRLINLRAIAWTLTLGESIFTIVFQTLDVGPEDKLIGHRKISQDEMLMNVRKTADMALSNALYDLYASDNFLRRDELWPALLKSWGWIILFLAAIAAAVFAALVVPWDKIL